MKPTPDSFAALRADWLKLRGVLYDPTTELPSLPAVLDDVRRRLEGNETVGLIYLDLSAEDALEPSFGWQSYDHLLRLVSDALRECRSTLLSSRDSLALVAVRSDEFVLFIGLGADAEEAPREAERLRRSVAERVRLRLRDSLDGQGPQVQLNSSVAEICVEPTVRIERAIYKALHKARELCRLERQKLQSGRLNELDRMLADGDIIIRFQPIIRLRDGNVHGYEALSSAPHDGVFETSDLLFSFAEETDRVALLEQLCRREALRQGAELLEGDQRLFLNCSAPAFTDSKMVSDLVESAERARIPTERVVIEVTERVAITEWRAFQKALADLRTAGFRVAIDDMGSGYSSLRVVAEIEPDYLKLDLSLVTDLHRSPIKQDLLETLVMLAGKIQAEPIAEGVEAPEELAVLQRLGVNYGQGFLFARPRVLQKQDPVHFPVSP